MIDSTPYLHLVALAKQEKPTSFLLPRVTMQNPGFDHLGSTMRVDILDLFEWGKDEVIIDLEWNKG